ncbi:hypothetical protein VN12_10305 [Pirellula sp. SH-Sr6A]|uniref:hypothetical protein n=1 Tax=Pirellula sp. SH-Sr6A TaxID=1632865 RepID=UPI00078BD254|nr:hypothetical protein [Pirellula sp. SH-Sr6A]AMV32506.1 hypothetical protein VN12_10305 [Pirellula sp. SH-Sr6A]
MRVRKPGIALLVVLASSSATYADWPWKHKASVDRARNNAWPQPFRAADAQAVVAPFEIMKANGWRENNTLGSLLFSQEDELSEAGKLKIQWVLVHAPQSQRVIYVKSGSTKESTDARVESVQLAVSALMPTGALPQILVTEIDPPTSSGVYQNLVHRALIRTTPAPRLSTFTGLNTPSKQMVAPNAAQDGTASGSK